MTNEKRNLWRSAVDRAADRPFFLASVLRAYQERHGMDDEQLATDLGCAAKDLTRLGLCRRPNPAGPFRADVEQIAARFGIVPTRLARLIREVDMSRKFGPTEANLNAANSGPGQPGSLLAARDHEPKAADESRVDDFEFRE